VKGQSNQVIAGSLRNIYRDSLGSSAMEVEHCLG
jgi:hypothetical protein